MQWTFDPTHSQVQFSVKHMAIATVRGAFDTLSGDLDVENDEVTDASVIIDVASINTGNEQRDTHLRSADFFAVEEFPTARFTLSKFERDGDDVTVTGELTLRGTTHPITLKGEIGGPSKDPWGNDRISASLTTKISRKTWGLTWNVALEAGGVLVSDDVKLAIEVQAVQAAVAAAIAAAA